MTHPLIPEILDLAVPLAADLNLEVVGAVFHTHLNPPVLRVDIRNLSADTSLEDCERMSHRLETALDAADLVSGTYVLEVSSPGISRLLSSDREFVSFRGFSVIVRTRESIAGQREWVGNLVQRDEEFVYLNQKGRAINIPRHLVTQVQLNEKRS